MEETLLDEIFWDRDQGVLRCLTKGERQVLDDLTDKEINVMNQIKFDNHEKKLRNLVHNVRNKKLRKEINNYIDLSMEDLLTREAERQEKYYKQGFKDGVSLIMECKS